MTDDEIIASVVPEDAGERPQVQSHPQYHCVCVLPFVAYSVARPPTVPLFLHASLGK